MHLHTMFAIAITSVVALPYALVLLWCLAYVAPESWKHKEMPGCVTAMFRAGGLLSLFAYENKFWAYMMWFPLMLIASSVSLNAAIAIMVLHLIATLALYLSSGHLAATLYRK